MTPWRLSLRSEFTQVRSHGSTFVYMTPQQNVMPARVIPAWFHPELLYRAENFAPLRNLATKRPQVSVMKLAAVRVFSCKHPHTSNETSFYCWFSHDVTKTQTKKLSILPRFYFHDALEQLKTNFPTNFRFKSVLGFVIEYAWIHRCKLWHDGPISFPEAAILLVSER